MRKPSPHIDYTNRDYEAFRESIIDHIHTHMPEYTDDSQTDAGIVIVEGLSNGLDVLSLYLDTIANDVILMTTKDRRIACLIAKILGYVPYNQTTSYTKQVFVLNSEKDEDVIIPKGTVVKTYSADEEVVEPLKFETVDDLRIVAGDLGDELDENGNYKYTVDVTQGVSISDDVVGSSNGSPYQTFTLSYQNVIVDTLRVYVQEEDGLVEYSMVDKFIYREIDSTSRVFTVSTDDYEKCTIEFGNGVKGKIPPAMSDGIVCDYRVGGGNASNVAANVITVLEDDVEGVEKTFNPDSSYILGHNIEPIEEIKENAPANFRVRERCVTLGDYEDILMIENTSLYPIWRAKAIQDDTDDLKVNLYLQMREGYEYSEDIVNAVAEYLENKVILGTSFDTDLHTDTVLDIEANLRVNRDYIQSEIQELVEAYIQSYFAGTEFTFNDTFISSDLEQEILTSIDGVDIFRVTSPQIDSFDPSEPQSIITLGTVSLNVSGGIVNE